MIESLKDFLAHAVRLETNAAEGYEWLADFMQNEGNAEVAALFRKLGEFSHMHRAEIIERYRQVAGEFVELPESAYRWPDGHSPEDPRATHPASDINTNQALQIALRMEREACDFYSAVANQSQNSEVQEVAQTFAEEESGHVSHLERWIARNHT